MISLHMSRIPGLEGESRGRGGAGDRRSELDWSLECVMVDECSI